MARISKINLLIWAHYFFQQHKIITRNVAKSVSYGPNPSVLLNFLRHQRPRSNQVVYSALFSRICNKQFYPTDMTLIPHRFMDMGFFAAPTASGSESLGFGPTQSSSLSLAWNQIAHFYREPESRNLIQRFDNCTIRTPKGSICANCFSPPDHQFCYPWPTDHVSHSLFFHLWMSSFEPGNQSVRMTSTRSRIQRSPTDKSAFFFAQLNFDSENDMCHGINLQLLPCIIFEISRNNIIFL